VIYRPFVLPVPCLEHNCRVVIKFEPHYTPEIGWKVWHNSGEAYRFFPQTHELNVRSLVLSWLDEIHEYEDASAQ